MLRVADLGRAVSVVSSVVVVVEVADCLLIAVLFFLLC